MRPCKRLVACLITPYIFTGHLHGRLPYCPLLYLCSASTGGGASDWLLAAGFNAEVLVTCTVAWVESGVYWKSLILGESIQLHQATWASAWSLAIVFNGNQGGRLSCCHCRMCTCIFSVFFFSFLRCLSVFHDLSRNLNCNLCSQMSVF